MATPATNQQMQTGADQYWRPFWEHARALKLFGDTIKADGDSWYARAISTTAWADARTDGPPNLLQSGNSSNPDDYVNLNSFITAFKTIIEGTDTVNDAANAAALRSAWNTGMRACVQLPPVFTQSP